MFFVSINFSIHSYLVHKSKSKKNNYIILKIDTQQNTVTFFSYSIRNYNVINDFGNLNKR